MNFEDRIREQRTTEATKKNLIGMEGKIYLIARFLGHEIISQSDEQNFLDDFLEGDYDQEKIFTLDENTSTRKLGYCFDGMSRGYHIEIYTDDNLNEIKLYYKGIIFYKESFGILENYVPHQEWENIIENLYIECQNRIEKFIKNKKAEEKESLQRLENETIKNLRKKWGDII